MICTALFISLAAIASGQDLADCASAFPAPAEKVTAPSRGSSGRMPDPSLDIRVNGQDSNVVLFDSQNVVIDVRLISGGWNDPADIWCLGWDPINSSPYCYGPKANPNWASGWSTPYDFGALYDIPGTGGYLTVLNKPLPVGSYEAYWAIDMLQDEILEIPYVSHYDVCDFTVVPSPNMYKRDDGDTENLLSFTSGGDIVGLQRFEIIPGGERITHVGTIFGSEMFPDYAPGVGMLSEFFMWTDPSLDMFPGADCFLEYRQLCQVQTVDRDSHDWFKINNTTGYVQFTTGSHIWIGFRLPHAPNQYCLAIDGSSSYVQGSSFITGCLGTQWGFDPADLDATQNYYPPIESTYGFWTVRAAY